MKKLSIYLLVGFVFITFSKNINAQSWSAVGTGLNNYPVNALTVYNGNLYAGGGFTMAGGNPANYIAEWNGTSWSSLGSGANGTVNALTTYNGNLIAGGQFSTEGIAQWNGATWSSMGNYQDAASSFAIYSDSLVAIGDFTDAFGNPVQGIAIWSSSVWSLFGIVNSDAYAVDAYNGNLYVGGSFTTIENSGYSGGTTNQFTEWNGLTWQKFYEDINGTILALTVYNGKLILGGNFTSTGGSYPGIVEWNGTSWSSLGSGISGGTGQTTINALTVYNGNLIVGGNFTTAGGNSANNIAEWNGTSWSSLGSGVNNVVSTLAVYNGNLYVGGYFTMAGGKPANYIAEWESPPLSITISGQTNIKCFSGTGIATANAATGGTSPYSYNWTPIGGTNLTASNLSEGTYTITVIDANSNTATTSVTISQPTPIVITMNTYANIVCFGNSTGSITANAATGGTPPYTYNWSPSGGTNLRASNLSAGTYKITATDNNGCIGTVSVSISQPAGMTIIRDSTPASGSCNGEAKVTVGGGNPPYTYSWSPGEGTNDTINGKCVGDYCCTITESDGCSQSVCITIKSATGIGDISNSSNINIYPDPNTGYFTIKGVSQGQVIELYNYMGQKLNSVIADNSTMHFDISTKADGIYLIKIQNKGGSIVTQKKIEKLIEK